MGDRRCWNTIVSYNRVTYNHDYAPAHTQTCSPTSTFSREEWLGGGGRTVLGEYPGS